MVLPIFSFIAFEWDEGNRQKNSKRHHVTIEECERVFFNSPLLMFDDIFHSKKEERWFALGKTDSGRTLSIVFTQRNKQIRVISARDMSKRERIIYGKT